MKKLISAILTICFISNIAFADCDFKTGITPGPNNTFIYTEACHQKVGQLVQTNQVQTQQIADLIKAIDLKSLAITNADARTQLWMSASDRQQSRLQSMESDQKMSAWLYIGLGVLGTIAAGYVASRVYR